MGTMNCIPANIYDLSNHGADSTVAVDNPNNRWYVTDCQDIHPDEFFTSEEDAIKRCEELNKTVEELTLCFKGNK